MTRSMPLALIQSAADVAGQLERVARAETVTAVGTVVLALLGVAIAIAAFSTLRALSRMLVALERHADRLAPRIEPILERVSGVTQDAAEISQSLRQDVERVHETLEELNQQLRAAAHAAEDRVRRFGAVVRVVQEEIEDLLLDAAAAARGVHTTAEALRRPSPARPAVRGRGEGEQDTAWRETGESDAST